MRNLSRLPFPPAAGTTAALLPGARDARERTRFDASSFACLVCGLTIGIKFDVVGEVYLFEILLAVIALQGLLARGPGRRFLPSLFAGFLVAGLLTFFGYLVADLAAANDPWQYLKGWGRVVLLVADTLAMLLVVAGNPANIRWMSIGMGIGGIAALLIGGVPLTQWKLGYGEFAALLAFSLAGSLPPRLAALTVGGFGVLCVVSDYRTLGAAGLVTAAYLLLGFRGETSRRAWKLALAGAVGLAAVAALLAATQEQFAQRRDQSNIGRYTGVLIAWHAIAESPLLGYGSWAADERLARVVRREVARMEGVPRQAAEIGSSLLPHSQILQSWVEGGLAGTAFFAFLGWQLARSLSWLATRRRYDALTPILAYLMLTGLWNLAASPFLGYMRIYLALTAGVVAVCAVERRQQRAARSRGEERVPQ